MLKLLLSLILLFSLGPAYGVLNESTKPIKINVYLERNPPFSDVNNNEIASGLLVDYWHEWANLTGIDVALHFYSENDFSFSRSVMDPAIYNGLQASSTLRKQSVKEKLFTIYGHFYFFDEGLLDKNRPLRVGGLLPEGQQLSFLSEGKDRQYSVYPGIFELIKALYEQKIDAIVLLTSDPENKSVLHKLLTLFLHEKKLADDNQSIFAYGESQHTNTLEWVNWGRQFVNDSNSVNQALLDSANSIFAASDKVQKNVLIIVILIVVFILYQRHKRKKDLQFKNLLDDSPYPLAIFSLDGSTIYYLNNEALTLLPTKKINDRYVFKDVGNQTVFTEFMKTANHKVVIEMETIQLLINDAFFDIEISGKKVYFRKKTAWLCHLKDINALLQTTSQLTEERELLNTVLNSIPEQVLFTSPKGIILSCNEAWANANGTTVLDATGNDISNVISPDLIDKQKKQETSVWNGKKLSSQEWTQKNNNELNLINSTKLPLYNNNHGVFGLLSIESDITDVYNLNRKLIDENVERKKAEIALAKQNTLLTTVFAVSIDPIGLLDQEGRVIGANDAFAVLMGYSNSDDIVGKLQSEFLSAERSDWVDIQNKNVLESEKPLIFDELIFFEGKKIWYEVSKMPFKDEDNDFKGIVIMARDISLHKQTEEKLTSAASDYEVKMLNDQLTGIANRRAFDIQFEMLWKEARDEQELLSVVMCDIDFFKLYNDNYGHQQGDRALKQVAQTLEKTAHQLGVFVARYGGEEFVVLSKGGNATKALKQAEVLREAVANEQIEHLYSVTSKTITMSMGLSSMLPSNLNTMAMLLAEADSALYESKKHGRNQVGVH
ncbi:transporter substrate-binding domain-containing diguanylate cyclase [Psychromonas sp. PT13]|uniref:sensor domain-containing diguanylate cyclase n=1 Tax=Psychromonas sp. PT13 TaxID=3439547 RepID=UPI003EBDC0BB